MFGMAADEAIGLPLVKLIPEASRAEHHSHIQLFRDLGDTSRSMGALGAISGRRSNGETFRIEAGISQATVDGKWFAIVILRDITERLANEEARNLLLQEGDHRAKNALTVVNAIVSLTTADSIEDYIEAITGRLDTLARAHSMLANASWTGGSLRQIIEEELQGVHAAGQVCLNGPNLTLSAKSIQPLSMLFHELATNALKYGALSVAQGTVTIRWSVNPLGSLMIRWIETKGPMVHAPSRTGFGSSLIESIEEQLHSQATINWPVTGLEFSIELPAGAFDLRRHPIENRACPALHGQTETSGRSVLVVEDDAIVALVLAAGLRSDGWKTIGPASTIATAHTLLAQETTPDVALLDINLNGEPVYPLAQFLQARNIPFAFYSGHSALILEDGYKNVPLIAKPARVHVINTVLSRLVADANLNASLS
jgi:PAS domain S-box-containing protein